MSLKRSFFEKIYNFCYNIHSKKINTIDLLHAFSNIKSESIVDIYKICKQYNIISEKNGKLFLNCDCDYLTICRIFIKQHLPYYKNLFPFHDIIKGRIVFIENCNDTYLRELLIDANLVMSYDKECAEIWKFWESIAREDTNENIESFKNSNGLHGEFLSMQFEKRNVSNLIKKYNISDLKPVLISIDYPHAGYDINSYCDEYDIKVVQKYVESKTTTNIDDGYIYITWNEYIKMRDVTVYGIAPNKYQIHLWNIKDRENPELYILGYKDIAPPVLPYGVSLDYFKVKINSLNLTNPICLNDILEF